MRITHTNRKGVTFYLGRGVTKTGKPRYFFAREPDKGAPVEAIPEGYEIVESVNGVVSLAKARPSLIRPEELALVQAAVAVHPKSRNYRVDVKGERIVVYEREGADPDHVARDIAGSMGLPFAVLAARMRETFDRGARFAPVLRFILADEAKRTFYVERWCYLGSIDDWVNIGAAGQLGRLVKQTVPKLGTEAFFELMWLSG
jgi:hypothetical protein